MSLEKLRKWSFPSSDLPRALQAILIPSGLPLKHAALPTLGVTTPERWLLEAPRALGLEAVTEALDVAALEPSLCESGPLLLRVKSHNTDVALAVMTGFPCRVYTPSGEVVELSPQELRRVILQASAANVASAAWTQGLQRGPELLDALAAAGELGYQRIISTRFRLDASHSLWSQARQDGATAMLINLILLAALRAGLAGLATFALGSAAITGRIDTARLVGWTLLVLTDVPLYYISSIVLGRLSIAGGSAFKRRLLEGTFHLSPDEVRGAGLGTLLARVSEAEVVEHSGLSEVMGLVTPLGIWFAALALAFKAPWPYLVLSLLLACTVLAVWLAWRSATTFVEQYQTRLKLTDDLVEKIVGHRTRILQRTDESTHMGEDEILHSYALQSKRYDTFSSAAAGLPRAWFVIGLVLLSAAFVQREPAIIYLVLSALAAREVWVGLQSATMAWAPWYCAWKALVPLMVAGRTQDKPWRPLPEIAGVPGKRAATVMVSNLSFVHPSTGRPILKDVALQMFEGERLLLEGGSGSGKSTFASLLAAERRPSAGTILVRGLDMDSVPKAEWRTRVAYAPQFHENYIFSSTFAFNLDPRAELGDVSPEAREICNELGLGPLLRRMPSAFVQTLGETGWQLSHGEKSRMYIARTLLQGAELVIFDESFGALDPETVQLVMKCVRKRAKTLLVIAHP